jgi:hypothetical protein
VPAGHVQLLLDSCDCGEPVQARDYLILMLVARLGLRSIEVARLQLGDIDWRGGRIIVHGKASREDGMSLPADSVERWPNTPPTFGRRPHCRGHRVTGHRRWRGCGYRLGRGRSGPHWPGRPRPWPRRPGCVTSLRCRVVDLLHHAVAVAAPRRAGQIATARP